MTTLSTGQVAYKLGVHPKTVRTWVKRGRIAAHQIVDGNRKVYRYDEATRPADFNVNVSPPSNETLDRLFAVARQTHSMHLLRILAR